MATDWNSEVKNLLLAGLGAVAMTAEKSAALVEELVKKGELTVAQGRVLNEELKHDLHKKGEEVTDTLSRKGYLTVQTVLDSLETMSRDERAAVRRKLEEMEKKDGMQEQGNPGVQNEGGSSQA